MYDHKKAQSVRKHAIKLFNKYRVYIFSAMFILGLVFLWQDLLLFLVITAVAFYVRWLWARTSIPIDFTLTFFGALIVVHKLGFIFMTLYIIIADVIAGIVAGKGFHPMAILFYIPIAIIGPVSAAIGGDFVINGIISAFFYFAAGQMIEAVMGNNNPYTWLRSLTGFLFSAFYFWRLWPIVKQFV